jgi:hypothetical protein
LSPPSLTPLPATACGCVLNVCVCVVFSHRFCQSRAGDGLPRRHVDSGLQ